MEHREKHHEKHHPDHVTQRCVPEPLETSMHRDAGVEITYCLVRQEGRGKGPLSDADCQTAEHVLRLYNGDESLSVLTRGRVRVDQTIFYLLLRGEVARAEVAGRIDGSEDCIVVERIVDDAKHWQVVVREPDDFWRARERFIADDENRANVMEAGRRWLDSDSRGSCTPGRELSPRVARAFLEDIGLVLWGADGDQGHEWQSELRPDEAPLPGTPAWKLNAIADRLRRAGIIGPFAMSTEAEVAFNPQPDPPGVMFVRRSALVELPPAEVTETSSGHGEAAAPPPPAEPPAAEPPSPPPPPAEPPAAEPPSPPPPKDETPIAVPPEPPAADATATPPAAKPDEPAFNPQPDPPGASANVEAAAPPPPEKPDEAASTTETPPDGAVATELDAGTAETDEPPSTPQPDHGGAKAPAAEKPAKPHHGGGSSRRRGG